MTDITNYDRATFAAHAMDEFQRVCSTDAEDVLTDLLCDLMHWAKQSSFDFDAELARAKGNFDAEVAEEKMMLEVKPEPRHVHLVVDEDIQTGETFNNVFATSEGAGDHLQAIRADYLKAGLEIEDTDLDAIAENTGPGCIEYDDDDHFEIVDTCCVKIKRQEILA